MNRMNLRPVFAALFLAVLSLATVQSGAAADVIDVAVCGKVTRFSAPGSNSSGTLVIGGDRFLLPMRTVVPAEITIGQATCLTLTFDTTGQISRVANSADTTEPGRPVRRGGDSDSAGAANPEINPEQPRPVADSADSAESHQVGDDQPSGGQGDLPVTGGSAPSGPLYAIVSLATVLLAAFGVFSARRGI